MNINQEIKNFKNKNRDIPEWEIDSLVKAVAMDCLQHVVDNIEAGKDAEGAWNSIRKNYSIEILGDSMLLHRMRGVPQKVQDAFSKACVDEDIKEIKRLLSEHPSININHSGSMEEKSHILTDMAMIGLLESLKFFIEDDFINKNLHFKSQVNFEEKKGDTFLLAYNYREIEVVRYLILNHNLEFSLEAQEILKNDPNEHNSEEFKKEVISIIQNKHLNFMLEHTLLSKEETKPRNKI